MFEFDLEIRTDDGLLITDGISARGDLSGNYRRAEPDVGMTMGWFEDIDIRDVEVDVGSFNRKTKTWEAQWVPMPDDLQPFLNRYIAANDDWLSEKLVARRTLWGEQC